MSLIDLPEELFSTLLSTWLTISEVAHLDSAFCSSVHRAEYTRTAFNRHTTLQYPPAPIERPFKQNFYLDERNRWLFGRGASVPGIYATPVFIHDHAGRRNYLQQQGNSIRWIGYTHELLGNYEDYNSSATDIAECCPNLTRFDGEDCHDETVLMKLIQNCPLLEEIKGFRVSNVQAVHLLAQKYTRLRRVELACEISSEECLIALVRNNPGLQTVKFRGPGITDSFACAMATRCTSLMELTLNGGHLMESSLHRLLEQCQKLHHMCLCNGSLSPQLHEVEPVVNRSMRSLFLGNNTMMPYQLEAIVRACPGLTDINIMKCSGLFEVQGLPFGTYCPDLQSLSILSEFEFAGEDMWFDISQYCPRIRELILPTCAASAATLLAMATNSPLLEVLDVRGYYHVTDEFLTVLAQHCANLRVLYVDGCGSLTDEGVHAVIQGCTKLVEFGVQGCMEISNALEEEVESRYPRKLYP